MSDIKCKRCGLYKNSHTAMGSCHQPGGGWSKHHTWEDQAPRGFDVATTQPALTAEEMARPTVDVIAAYAQLATAERAHRALALADKAILSTDSQERKDTPIYSGVLAYFPRAIAYVARVSKAGNVKHNGPDAPLEWTKGKSNDHADCVARHLIDHGTIDSEDNLRHTGKLAWRALALLETELEKEEGL